VSDGSTQDTFVRSAFALPLDGYGGDLKFRFSSPGSDVTDFWHLDDILISTDSPCRADLTGDGSLDFFDFLTFQNLFAAGDLKADFTGDGSLDFFDFLAFQNEFAAGCP
jgi:hypothetical protein